MSFFVIVFESKTNMSNNINVTIPKVYCNIENCNISNPGPLEQNPGPELGWPVLLYKYFYVC